jgi:hypothetical protein
MVEVPGEAPVARPSSSRAARWSGPLAVAGAAIACAAVAIAAAGAPLRAGRGDTTRIHVTPWLAAVPVVALIVLGIVGLASFRHLSRLQGDVRRPRWLTFIALLVTLLGFLLLMRPERDRDTRDIAELEIAPPAPAAGNRQTAWPVWLGVAAGATLAVVAALGARRHVRRPQDASVEPTEMARQVLAESAEDLSTTAEPRQAVIAAYARLLEGLREAGAGRRPSEAPFEHVSRVLGDLGVRAEPLRQLTALFAEARFSTHEITEAHRTAALDALAAARADLAEVPACV